MRIKILLVIWFLIFFTGQGWAQGKAAVMTNANIIKLHKAGLNDDIILSRIDAASCKFDVLDDGLIALKKEGVSDRVIKAMLDKVQGNKTLVNQQGDTKTNKTPFSSRPSLPDPQTINAVYHYDRDASSIKPLEKINATQKAHKGGLGFGAMTYTCEVAGNNSTTRLNQADAVSFVVNTGGTPPDAFVLFKVEIKKQQRVATTSKITGTGSVKGAQGNIACNVKMLKTGIYEISPASKLDKGEYFFTTKQLDYTTMANMDVYAFGID